MCRKKFKKYILKPIFSCAACVCCVLLSGIAYMSYTLPNDYHVIEGENLELNAGLPISVTYMGEKSSDAGTKPLADERYQVELKALGFIPIKQAGVSVIDETSVAVLGKPFGIKIYTDGVMVVDIDSVDTEHGNQTPAADAGLKEGDLILSINGQRVYSNEDVAAIIESSGGAALKLQVMRNDQTLSMEIKPALSYSSGKYKTGIWVRDSSAGIGTLTFYSPSGKVVCGLGHGVCDVDTGELLTLNSGELVDAEILGVSKGSNGNPGELKGRFKTGSIGPLIRNDETGVYATCEMECDLNQLTKIALKQEVTVGAAQILTTVDGESEPALYSCQIEKVAYNDSITKNMVIRVTDEALLQKTGGIVQGMSGSPIFQNGKLVGAVTHVFINDSTSGYAIFAENMLKTVQSAATEQKKAS